MSTTTGLAALVGAGRKAYQLRMDLPGMQRSRADSGALSALCFSSLGDVLMGYSGEEQGMHGTLSRLPALSTSRIL